MHLHTPASADYRDPDATYLKILQRAEERGLDIIAFTDHNSTQGYAEMLEEIHTLEMLEGRGRLNEQEIHDLAEYRRLRETLLVLPGFEFTATFGFHILGIFPPGYSLRKIEILLLKLDVPEAKMLAGAPDAGPTSDVIEAYEAITEAGGLAIAAHANSSNGVAMQGFNFGGQTKIAYTQHEALAALEVTDLEQSGRRTTESFFNGSKPEYPRRMHCIQGSDAHSIDKEPGEGLNKRLGVGDRCTELLLPASTFAAIRDLFAGKDFDRLRPYRPGQVVTYDFVRQARAQGPSIVQSFHERASTKTNHTRAVLKDVAAFANTNGGNIYLGVSADEALPVRGVDQPDDTMNMLRFDIQRGIVPPLEVTFATHTSDGRPVLLLQVPRGADRPYMFEPAGQIYLRQEADSVVATRDDIVRLVLEAQGERMNAELAAAALSVPTAQSAATAKQLADAEEASAEMVEDAVAGSSVPLDTAHRRKRRRRRGGDRAPEPALSDQAPEDEVGVPAWETTPAWEAPEDSQPAAESQEAAEISALHDFAGVPTSPPSATGDGTGAVARPRRKGTLYQVYRAKLGEQEVGNANKERRAGLFADKAGELLDADVRSANPDGMFEMQRNQLWLPQDVEPRLPESLLARPRSKSPLNDTILNAKSGPGGHFQTGEELAPPLPEPEPEPAKKPARGRRKAAPAAQPAQAPAPAPAAQQAPEVPPPQAPAPTGGIRALPGEKLSGRKAAAAATAPAPAAAEKPSARKPAATQAAPVAAEKPSRRKPAAAAAPPPAPPPAPAAKVGAPTIPSPRTGVEIVSTEIRNGVPYHAMRDLRNGSIVHNVTRYSARRLWYYAIMRHEVGLPDPDEIEWSGDVGLWRKVRRANLLRYDLVGREPDGSLRVYYGVTEDGIQGPWREIDLASGEAVQAGNEKEWA